MGSVGKLPGTGSGAAAVTAAGIGYNLMPVWMLILGFAFLMIGLTISGHIRLRRSERWIKERNL